MPLRHVGRVALGPLLLMLLLLLKANCGAVCGSAFVRLNSAEQKSK